MKGSFVKRKGLSQSMDGKMPGSYVDMPENPQASSKDSGLPPAAGGRRWFSLRRSSDDTVALSRATVSQRQGQSNSSSALRTSRGAKKRDRVYAKTGAHIKAPKERSFNQVYYRQRLRASASPIWTMKFNKTGQLLAASGDEPVVKVWRVVPAYKALFLSSEVSEMDDSRPYFDETPFRLFEGHSKTVVDVDWSSEDVLISASVDKTARVWDVHDNACMRVLYFKDIVSSVAFHPHSNTVFVAATFGGLVQAWSILELKPKSSISADDFCTTTSITADGKYAMVGTLNGHIKIMSMKNEVTRGWELKDVTQIDIRPEKHNEVKVAAENGSAETTNIAKKVTGIINSRSGAECLITTNDSHVRMYMTNDKSLRRMYKGHPNDYSCLKGTFSHDERFVLCPSDYKTLSIWEREDQPSDARSKNRVDMVNAFEWIAIVEDAKNQSKMQLTAALFAPRTDVEANTLLVSNADIDMDYTLLTASASGVITVMQAEGSAPVNRTGR